MRIHKKVSSLLALVFIVQIFFSISSAKADVAPPMNPPGGNISPEGQTEVSMIAERVLIDFRKSTDNSAQVSAEFLFRNLGMSDEHMKVRFPLNGDVKIGSSQNGETDSYPLVTDFEAYVNGKQVNTSIVEETDPENRFFLGSSGIIYWATFEADFPVGMDTKIKVRYTLKPTDLGGGITHVFYFLATGAGWKDPIGSVDIIVRLPYRLTPENSPEPSWHNREQEMKIVENEAHWHWDNLEPTSDDNLDFTFIKPSKWMEILRARGNVISDPENGETWAKLGKAYYEAGAERNGYFTNPQMKEWCLQAFDQALALSPTNLDIHIEYTKVLFYESPFATDDLGRWERILWEIAYILNAKPQIREAQILFDDIKLHATLSEVKLVLPSPGGTAPAYTDQNSIPTRTPITESPTHTSYLTNTLSASTTHRPKNTQTVTLSIIASNDPTTSSSPEIAATLVHNPKDKTDYTLPIAVICTITGCLIGIFVTKQKK